MLTLAGCSAGNLTGFDFPSFGLTKKSGDPADDTAAASYREPYPDPRLGDR